MTEQLQLLSVESLHPADWNRDIGDVDELVESIKDAGVLQPVLVRPNADGFQIVAGERRWTAAKAAGLTEIPTIVRELDDRQALEIQLIENLQRKDIEPLEEAEGFKRLGDFGLKQSEIAEKVRRSPAHVSKRLSLLELPEVAREALSARKVSIETALMFGRIKERPDEIADILKHDFDYPDEIEFEVEQIESSIRLEKRTKEAEQRAASEGIKLVPRPSYNTKSKVLAGAKANDWDHTAIAFTKQQHKAEPCHAACVVPRDGKQLLEYVCTDPARHRTNGESSLKLPKDKQGAASTRKLTPQEKKQRAEDAERRRAAKARLEVLRELMKPRVLATAEQHSILIEAVLDRALYDAQKIAVEILELGDEKSGSKDVRGLIERFVEKKADNGRIAALAIALANDEISMRSSWSSSDMSDYLGRLVRHGHELSDIERKRTKSTRVQGGGS